MTRQRFMQGLGWGIVATIAMSLVMAVGVLTGASPMPEPIPLAIVANVVGGSAPKPLLMILAVLSHLAYGGVFGGLAAIMTARMTVWKGVGLGIALWLVMQVAVLPYLGWGPFGTGVTPRIAGATLVLHLVYGATFGALMDRRTPPVPSSMAAA